MILLLVLLYSIIGAFYGPAICGCKSIEDKDTVMLLFYALLWPAGLFVRAFTFIFSILFVVVYSIIDYTDKAIFGHKED